MMKSIQMNDVPWVQLLTLDLIHNLLWCLVHRLNDVRWVQLLARYLIQNNLRLFASGSKFRHCNCYCNIFCTIQTPYNLYIERVRVGSDSLFQLCHLKANVWENKKENIIHNWRCMNKNRIANIILLTMIIMVTAIIILSDTCGFRKTILRQNFGHCDKRAIFYGARAHKATTIFLTLTWYRQKISLNFSLN